MRRLLLVAATVALACTPVLAELKPGEEAPEFKLFGVDYRYHSLAKHEEGKAIVLIFTCNHCPVSVQYEDKLVAIAKEYQPKGIVFLAINPNPADKVPADGFPQMIERAEEKGFPFPYLYDETQEVAIAYGATNTPHVFAVGPDRKVVYEGAVDDRHKEPDYLTDALDAILAGEAIEKASTAQWGCSVKYREKKQE